MKVLVINHCSTNKGDKAVLEFVLNELAANGIRRVTVSSNEPSCCNIAAPPGVDELKFVPWGWNDERNRATGLFARLQHKLRREFYPRSYAAVRRKLLRGAQPKALRYYCNGAFWKALQSADLVVSTGGHHVTTILATEAISPQTFEMALALLAGKPLFLWSQSVGPFDFTHDENRQFIREILVRSAAIFVRDHRSLDELVRMGVSRTNVRQTYESVLGLSASLGPLSKPSERSPLVGIAVYSAQTRSAVEHQEYIASLRDIVNHVTATGHRVQFFPMQLQNEVADDRPCINAVLDIVRERDMCTVYKDASSMLEHINEVGRCRYFIGHKTHSVIIALITGTPLLAIAYHPKTTDFMEQFELAENCLDDRLLDGPTLIDMFEQIRAAMDPISEQQLEKSKEFGAIVRRDFRDMLLKNIVH